MSVTLMGLCWRIEWPTMPMRLIALKLADCANDDGENVYPSVDRIERETGLGTSTVRRDLASLEEAGVLEVIEERHGNRWGRSTTIRRFDVERLKGLAWTERRHHGETEVTPSILVLAQTGPIRMVKGKPVKTWEVALRGTGAALQVPPLHHVEGPADAPADTTPNVAPDATPPRGGGAEPAPPLHVVDPTPPPPGATPPRGGIPPTPPYKARSIIDPSLKKDPPQVPQQAGGRRPPTSYLPFDWTLPEPDRAWALAHAPSLSASIQAEADAFRDWHAGKRRADWSASWRTWVRRAASYRRGRAGAANGAGGGTGWRDPCPPARGGMVHNTDEPIAAYRERMIREGKIDATEARP